MKLARWIGDVLWIRRCIFGVISERMRASSIAPIHREARTDDAPPRAAPAPEHAAPSELTQSDGVAPVTEVRFKM